MSSSGEEPKVKQKIEPKELYKLRQETRDLPKKKFSRIKHLPPLDKEPDYVIKTRPPMLGDWRLNAVRGIKENALLKEAGPIASRK
mmetsp:Transcript_18804/g.18469  ORF Transcript_18804/g.18469 Transcript_18804/m.18469 type:complete len:86 (+) Transcript_18804:17-274(+)